MTPSAFRLLLDPHPAPVVLLEGTRDLPADVAPRLTALAGHLARSFPMARFRTGNATGSDAAFAAGVIAVDPTRLEFVVPYATHRASQRPSTSTSTALDDVPDNALRDLIDTTVRVSPRYQQVAVNYRQRKTHPRQKASAQLLLRDTLKVTGGPGLTPPVAGVFYVNPTDPDRGGIGHTVRVCRAHHVPVITQVDWLTWPV